MSYKTLIDCLRERVKDNPNRVASRFVDYDEKNEKWVFEDHTIEETYYKALEIAYMLRKKGLKPGDRAVIFSMQDYGTMFSVFGCMMAGVVFTIIPPPLDEGKVDRFIAVLKSCQPKALISNYALESESDVSITGRLLKDAFRDTLRLKRIYTDRLVPYRRTDVIVPATENTLVYLQYTSGSTNAPKGVRITWKNLLKNLEQCINCYDFNQGTLATWVPFFHNLGLVITICMLPYTTGATAYYLQTMRFLENPKLWIRMMNELNLTLTVGPGSAYDACTRVFSKAEASKYALPQVTHFMNGSEFINADSVKRFTEMFECQPNAMAPGYGLGEAVCLATFASQDYRSLKLNEEAFQKNKVVLAKEGEPFKSIVSVGKPVKDLLVVIGNPKTHKPYPDDRIGEIHIAGDSVADGYWGNIKDNANFHGKLEGYDCNFYKTGDLGFIHEGHLYITGRIKEMLIVNGHNIYPSDLTLLIQKKIPSLALSTFGFFSCTGDAKEHVIAVVESNPEEDFEKRVSQINSAVSERFGFSFYDIIFVPNGSIPRTDNRKLQMLKARAMYEDGSLNTLYSSRAFKTAALDVGRLEKPIEMAEELFDKADEVLVQVKAVFEKVLDIEQYSLSDSFLELGGDSLMGFELVNSIEEKFHIKLDLRELLQDSSVNGVTKYIHRILSGAGPTGKRINLAKECRLEDEIRITSDYLKEAVDCRKIFLTGATGFLGAQLIRALIEQYPTDGLEIHCLVRSDSKEAGMDRLIRNQQHYECWKEEYRQYLYPVIGDLSSHHFALSDEEWTELANTMEVVYHNGALLNFVFPYQFLKTTNVGGTIETLRLACEGNPKYYHFVSSYSVYDTPPYRGHHALEDDPMNHWKGFSLAYSETKWVSEKIVGIAKKRGLKAVIYRPGDITGAANGIWEMDDMVSRMIVSTIQMKAVPRARYSFHMTPVDYVAKALVYISRKEDAFDHAFNLINPVELPLNTLVRYIRSCGYPISHIPFPIWKRRIKNSSAEDNAMVLLECLFEAGTDSNPNILRHFVGKDPIYDTQNTRLMLGRSGIKCPVVDREMINSYLKYFEKKGYI